jgi:hypothetical protein
MFLQRVRKLLKKREMSCTEQQKSALIVIVRLSQRAPGAGKNDGKRQAIPNSGIV